VNRCRVAIGAVVFALAGLTLLAVVAIRLASRARALPAEVRVTTRAPGLDAPHVEMLVTVPLERRLMGLPGLVRIESASRPGASSIELAFGPGTDLPTARGSVMEAIAASMALLPPSISPPELAPRSSRARLVYVLESETLSSVEVRTIQDWSLRFALLAVPGVIDVEACGGGLRELRVLVDEKRLAAFGLTVGDVATALSRALGANGDRAAIEEAVVFVREGAPVRVRDIAAIEDGASPGGIALHAGHRVVLASVRLHDEADTSEVAARVREKLAALASTLPRDVRVKILEPASEVRVHAPDGLTLEKLDEAVGGSPGVTDHAVRRDLDGATEVVIVTDRPALPELALASLSARLASLGATSDVDAVSFLIQGEDLEALGAAASRSRNDLCSIPGVTALAFEGDATAPSIDVVPDHAKLAATGVSADLVALAIETATRGRLVGFVAAADRRLPVVLRLYDEVAPRDLSLRSTSGALVPLSSVAALREAALPSEILRSGGRRCVRAIVSVDPRSDRTATAELLRQAIATRLAPGCMLERER
jgi:Cu/Ag efflux pump CusA